MTVDQYTSYALKSYVRGKAADCEVT